MPSSSPSPDTSRPQRFVCIHGHFYQPPRENPWLETVEVQESAAPYHDWNERITSECYAPNGASRITDRNDDIIRILNNYSRISFNFGPTLLSWLEEKAHRTYRMILDADLASAKRYGGHGSAMAQVYNHIIMPLASERDARTQIRWGIADFEYRFGRKPEGMWLAETAVNRHVLDLMAQEGIKFTVLAPNQCRRVRPTPNPVPPTATTPNPASPTGATPNPFSPTATASNPVSPTGATPHPVIPTGAAGAVEGPASTHATETHHDQPWTPTPDAAVDPTHPYRIPLDNGRSIAVFFYDGPGSRAIAFEGLLNSGETFGRRLLGGLPANPDPREPAYLSHVATDGESYGHHHKHGEMALSYAMHWIEDSGEAQLTNYGEFLDRFPPQWEAEVNDDTSWSCFHGVERWRSNCGCNGGKPGWNQEWRGPLRQALDLLRDQTAPMAEQLAHPLLKDFWAARDAYIDVVLNNSKDRSLSKDAEDRFLAGHATHKLSPEERTTVWELMELERHTQLMYTSCGWFFDEISGIETVQIIAYAGRVLQLAASLFGPAGAALEPAFLEILARAKSNIPEIGNGAEVYRRNVSNLRVGLEQVGAHYAISSIFREYPEDGRVFCYHVRREDHQLLASGRGRLAIGRAQLRSDITEELEEIAYAVLHLGDQNLSAAIRRFNPDDPAELAAFSRFSEDVDVAIRRANLPEVIHLIERFFGNIGYSLSSLFTDEQHRILRSILDRTLSEMEDSLRKIYEDHASLLHFLTESGMTVPPALALAAGYAINAALRRALEADDFKTDEFEALLHRAIADQIALDTAQLSYAAGQRMKRAMVRLEHAVTTESIHVGNALQTALSVAETLRFVPFEVNLWQAQNIWNDLLQRSAPETWPESHAAREDFRKLGLALNIAVDQLVVEEGVTIF